MGPGQAEEGLGGIGALLDRLLEDLHGLGGLVVSQQDLPLHDESHVVVLVDLEDRLQRLQDIGRLPEFEAQVGDQPVTSDQPRKAVLAHQAPKLLEGVLALAGAVQAEGDAQARGDAIGRLLERRLVLLAAVDELLVGVVAVPEKHAGGEVLAIPGEGILERLLRIARLPDGEMGSAQLHPGLDATVVGLDEGLEGVDRLFGPLCRRREGGQLRRAGMSGQELPVEVVRRAQGPHAAQAGEQRRVGIEVEGVLVDRLAIESGGLLQAPLLARDLTLVEE